MHWSTVKWCIPVVHWFWNCYLITHPLTNLALQISPFLYLPFRNRVSTSSSWHWLSNGWLTSNPWLILIILWIKKCKANPSWCRREIFKFPRALAFRAWLYVKNLIQFTKTRWFNLFTGEKNQISNCPWMHPRLSNVTVSWLIVSKSFVPKSIKEVIRTVLCGHSSQ